MPRVTYLRNIRYRTERLVRRDSVGGDRRRGSLCGVVIVISGTSTARVGPILLEVVREPEVLQQWPRWQKL